MSKRADFVSVAVPLPIYQTFTYRLPLGLQDDIQPGCRVLVPFGSRHLIGVLVKREDPSDGRDLKSVLKVLDKIPIISKTLIDLAQWLSWYYLAPLGECLKIMFPPGLLAKRASPDQNPEEFWPAKKQLAVVESSGKDAESLGLTPRQGEVFEFLLGQQLPVLIQQLVRELRCTPSLLQSLVSKGAIKIDQIDLLRSPWSEIKVPKVSRHELSEDQSRVLSSIVEAMEKRKFQNILLHGVTASGKTEIYLNAIAHALEKGKTALMLVPEIGLTPQVSHQFRGWFGQDVAILHSALSDGERFDQWRRIRKGQAKVVVGTRSAVFAPLSNLGLIVVDEEHDSSYKQGEQPRYNGRDTALKRGQLEKAPVILGSATPQLETFYNATQKAVLEYQPLSTRILERPLPTVHIVDMRTEFQARGKSAVIAHLLLESIESRLQEKEQTLVLINRRGYASAIICRSCGYCETCVNCSITLTFHQEMNRLSCHYCGYGKSVPSKCPECAKPYIYFVGEGTEKIQEILSSLFPKAVIDRLDRDTARRKGSYERILGAFRQGRTDILVGTQMISKGHDFPGVTLVGVLGTDQTLKLADFRAAERTFYLLTQVAGRAGRGEKPGEVVIQTYYPDHYSLKYAGTQDYLEFARMEFDFRRKFRYPPFVALANLIVSGEDFSKTQALAKKLVERLQHHRKEFSSSSRMRILGPAPAALERLKKDYRIQVVMKGTDRRQLHEVLFESLVDLRKEKADTKRISIDIDPVNLL